MKQLIVVLGAVGISFSAIFFRWSTAPTFVLILYRALLVMLILLPVILTKHCEELRKVTGKQLALCAASGFCMAGNMVSYFTALQYTSIASAVVMVDLDVLFVAFAMLLFFRQKLSRRAWMSIALALFGSVVIATADTTVGSNPLLGDALALLGAVFIASNTMIGSVCRRNMANSVYTFFVHVFVALGMLAVVLVTGTPLTGHASVNFATALGMAVCCTLLGHSIFSWGLKYLSPAFISMVKLIEPVISTVLALVLFTEIPSPQEVVGGAVVIVAVGLFSRANEKTDQADARQISGNEE